MAKPSTLLTWATDANYNTPGELYNGTATKVEPTSGRKATGHEPSKRPPAQQLNWVLNNIALWLAYLSDGLFTHLDRVKHIGPAAYQSVSNWALTVVSTVAAFSSSGAGDGVVPLDLHQGDRFKSFTLSRLGDGAADLVIGLWRTTAAGVATLLRSVTVTNPAAAWTDTTIAPAASGAITGTISTAATGSITRSAGDFSTDGFLQGQEIQLAGFANGGNNVSKIISTVTATVITFTSNAGLVNEAGTGDETVTQVFPTVGAGESYHLNLNASATGLRVGATRVTYDRPSP